MGGICGQPSAVLACLRGKVIGVLLAIGMLRQRQFADKAALRQFVETAQDGVAAIKGVLQAIERVKQPPFVGGRQLGGGNQADAIFDKVFKGMVRHGVNPDGGMK